MLIVATECLFGKMFVGFLCYATIFILYIMFQSWIMIEIKYWLLLLVVIDVLFLIATIDVDSGDVIIPDVKVDNHGYIPSSQSDTDLTSAIADFKIMQNIEIKPHSRA